MCIIIHKSAGVDMPSKAILEECFWNNPDGAGYMLKRGGLLYMAKGFMTANALLVELLTLDIQASDELALHFRITTSGGTIPANCHPFPLTSCVASIKAIEHRLIHAGLMHNGIIGQGADDMSDTMLFTRDVLSLKDIQEKLRKRCAVTIEHIAKATSGSRLLIMQAGSVETIRTGTWVEDNGLHYSNTSYLPRYTSYAYDYEAEIVCPACYGYFNEHECEAIDTKKSGLLYICPDCFHTFTPEESEAASLWTEEETENNSCYAFGS